MVVAGARALIGDGGLLRQVEARCHLTRTKAQIAVALLLTWVPTMVFGYISEHLTGRVPLVHDMAVHVRMLVATPLLLFLDRVFPVACTHVVDELARDAFIKPADQPRFEQLIAKTRRLCEWWVPEVVLVAIALPLSCTTLFVTRWSGGLALRAGLTAADWWYALVALPLFEFLLYRSLWRWLIWARFLVGLSRLDLDLDATHPDRRGGIAFLRRPSLAYCAFVLVAVSAVLSASWSERFQLASMTSFVPLLLALAAFAVLVAFGPLVLFTRQLQRTRVALRDALGGLATRNGRWFRERWLDSPAGAVVASSEVQSLSSLVALYRDTVEQMRRLLVTRRDLLLVVIAALAPVVPVMLMRIPRDEWMLMTSFLVSRTGLP